MDLLFNPLHAAGVVLIVVSVLRHRLILERSEGLRAGIRGTRRYRAERIFWPVVFSAGVATMVLSLLSFLGVF